MYYGGSVCLRALYAYMEADPTGRSLHGSSKKGREYGKLVTAVASQVAEKQGFYLWGKYEKNGLWRNIYLGKAGFGKTANLQARIREELKDESFFLWHHVLDEQELFRIGEKHYPRMAKKYLAGWKRVIRKSGTTYIHWVDTPDLNNDDVRTVESDLIETMNPYANKVRPSPVSELQEKTINVIFALKSQIHSQRESAFRV